MLCKYNPVEISQLGELWTQYNLSSDSESKFYVFLAITLEQIILHITLGSGKMGRNTDDRKWFDYIAVKETTLKLVT